KQRTGRHQELSQTEQTYICIKKKSVHCFLITAKTMETPTMDNSYENQKGIYTGLNFPDNHVYSTLAPEPQKPAKSKHCPPPLRQVTVSLGLLCAFLVVVIIFLGVYLEIPKQCPLNFVLFDSRCYYFSPEKKNWTDSRTDCKGRGADLVIINTKKEQMFIHSQSRQEYWIGLYFTTDRTWLWVDGSPLTIRFWRAGEPNGFNDKENCAHGSKHHTALEDWNDIKCIKSFEWVCEAKPQ
ncbi:hypothetical protein GJAV_G00098940, partial [Gymnothorax javanicus]